MKESQLKNSLNLIEFLSKDNKKLRLQYESLGTDNINSNNYKLMEEIKKRDKEIRQLEKEYKGNIPSNVLGEFVSGVDKDRSSEMNLSLINKINDMFSTSVN